MIEIDGFIVDVAVRETHQFPSEVTRHPVEEGADITDHVRNRPVMVTLEGVVSDTPIGVVANARSDSSLPSDDAFAKMQQIRDAREPVTITTSLRTYESMVLQSLNVPRTATTGDALRFRATFQQIQLVTNDRTTVPVDPPRAKRKVRRGAKSSKQEDEKDVAPTPAKSSDNASILYKLLLD